MKKTLITLSGLLVAVGAFAQGQVNFAPRVVGVYDAPVFLNFVGGPDKVSGPAYMVQLYAGATQASLAPVGAALPFRVGVAAGYWTAEARTINTVDASGNAFFQVRAWATAAGSTYEAAWATGAAIGSSNILQVKPTTAPDLPATLIGLSSFVIFPVPEPTIMALGVFGGLVLLLRRRK
ncbi:MAG: hypothetical protein ABI651_04955 [Verrucomicrobiota bacterium]